MTVVVRGGDSKNEQSISSTSCSVDFRACLTELPSQRARPAPSPMTLLGAARIIGPKRSDVAGLTLDAL